jgi:hypothetical protein
VLHYLTDATIEGYHDDKPRPGYKWVAIEVRTCITENHMNDDITLSWGPWSLYRNDGTTFTPADSFSPDVLVAPLYPQFDRPTKVGQCRKGFIPFGVPARFKPDRVEYRADVGDTLAWRL